MRRFLLLLILSSCTLGSELKHVRLDPLFNDNNSKVWLIDKKIVDDRNIGPSRNTEKKIIIFYSGGNYQISNLHEIAGEKAEKGTYEINSEKKQIKLINQKKTRTYDLTYIDEHKIVMMASKSGMEIIPLPEF